jgi:hypothetical protein
MLLYKDFFLSDKGMDSLFFQRPIVINWLLFGLYSNKLVRQKKLRSRTVYLINIISNKIIVLGKVSQSKKKQPFFFDLLANVSNGTSSDILAI